MKSFIVQVFFFTLTFSVLSAIISSLLPDIPYWGNPEYKAKIEEFKRDQYNTVFFGSSRILTGINPLIVDSLLKCKESIPIKSYNLATSGTWANETFYIYEEFLKDSSLSNDVKTVFMEFQNIMAIKFEKLQTSKVIYYQNKLNLVFVKDFATYEAQSDTKRIPAALLTTTLYSLASLEEQFNMGKARTFLNAEDENIATTFNYRGHKPLNRLASQFGTKVRINDYVKSVKINLPQTKEKPNKAFYEKMMSLIELSKAKGIKLVFILPPVKLTKPMMTVYNALPEKHKIELCDPEKYKELYQQENWADETHLNTKGTLYLNQYLVDLIASKVVTK